MSREQKNASVNRVLCYLSGSGFEWLCGEARPGSPQEGQTIRRGNFGNSVFGIDDPGRGRRASDLEESIIALIIIAC